MEIGLSYLDPLTEWFRSLDPRIVSHVVQILRLGSWLVILTVVFIPLERLFALHPISQTTNTPVPEPGSLMLLSTGLIGVGSYVGARYSKNKATNL